MSMHRLAQLAKEVMQYRVLKLIDAKIEESCYDEKIKTVLQQLRKQVECLSIE